MCRCLFPTALSLTASTRKVKTIWILLEQETVSGSGSSWTICKSAPRSRQITTPAPHHSVFYRPDALPAAKPTASKHWRHEDTFVESVWGKSLTCSSSSRENGWARARLSTSQRVTANDQTSLFVENLPWTHRNNSSLIRSLIVYTVGQKSRNQFPFVRISFNTRQKLVNFFCIY